MTQRKKTAVTKSPAKIGTPDEAKAAFEEIRAELQKLSPADILTVNVDIPRAASIALGAEPHIRSYEGHIKQSLPTHALDAIRRLRVYALGAVYAHLESQPVTKRADLSLLINEGTTLKQQLMVAAEALAFAGLVDDGRLAEIRAGSGHLDLATDLVALGALFDVSWKAVAGKTAIDRAQVDRASLLGTELLVALGAKDHMANRVTPEAIDMRNRAFTLLVRSYDSARRALAYLRWDDGDVDQVAPSLYQRPRKRAAAPVGTAPVDEQPDGADDAVTPSSGLASVGTQ